MRCYLLGLAAMVIAGGLLACGGEADQQTPVTTPATSPGAEATRPIRTIDDAEAKRLQTNFCTSCHSLDRVRKFRANYDGWMAQLRQGKCRKSLITPLDQAALAYYLSRKHPAGR